MLLKSGFFKVVYNCSSRYLVLESLSMCMASRMLNFGMPLLLSKAPMMHRRRMVWYFAFKLRITPWSIGWVMDMVFFGRKTTVIGFRFSLCGCAGQMSGIITTFGRSWWNFLSNSNSPSSKSSPLTQFFACARYRHEVPNSWKTSWFLRFAYNEHWQLFVISICCSCSLNRTLL